MNGLLKRGSTIDVVTSPLHPLERSHASVVCEAGPGVPFEFIRIVADSDDVTPPGDLVSKDLGALAVGKGLDSFLAGASH